MTDVDNRSESQPAVQPSGHATVDGLRAEQTARGLWALRWMTPIAIVLLVTMAFMPALSAGFVYWDDDDLLFAETTYRQLSLQNLKWMFSTSYAGHFQPLTWLTYSLDYQIWGIRAFGYHLTNVALHILTAVGFYFVSRRLLTAGSSTPLGCNSRRVILAAAFATALFAIHPLRAESVAWIAERRDVLSGFFYVLAVLAYLRYAGKHKAAAFLAGTGRAGRHAAWNYMLAVGFCALSILAKASAVMLPFVLLILDVYPLRRLPPLRDGARRSHVVWLDKLPFLIMSLLGGIRAVMAQADSGALYAFTEHSPLARAAQATYGFVFYIWKTLFPTGLGPLYPIPAADVLYGRMFWMSAALVGVLLLMALSTYRRWPALSAVLAVYFIQVLPVLGFVQSGPQLVADRYSYLSCMGFAVLAGAVMLKWLRRPTAGRSQLASGLTAVTSFGLVVLLSHATFAQNEIWDTPLSLWARGVRVSPNSSVANVNLADALAMNGYAKPAIRFYRAGLTLDPSDEIAASHLGQVLEKAGDIPRAIRMYQLAIALDDTRGEDYLRLARLLARDDQALEAASLLRRRAREAPGDLSVAAFLADMLATHPDDEVRNGTEAVRWATQLSNAHNGADPLAQLYLSTALAEAGRFAEAVEVAEEALQIPDVRENARLAAEFERRIALFRNNRTYDEGHTTNPGERPPSETRSGRSG